MGTAMQRTCDIQMNKCFNDANSRNGGFSPSDCSKQYRRLSPVSIEKQMADYGRILRGTEDAALNSGCRQ